MENEINEDIIPSQNNDEIVEEIEAETEVENENEVETDVEAPPREPEAKPQETPEAKFARLTRQAEKLAKKHGFQPKPKVQTEQPTALVGLSYKDAIALTNAKVHEDDVDEVLEYAKFKKISIGEALKSSVIRASLKEKEDLRTTANATNAGKARSGNSKVSGDTLLERARKTGDMPDREEDLDALLEARYKK